MKLQTAPLTLALLAVTSSALILPLKQEKRSSLRRRGGGTKFSLYQPNTAQSFPAVMAASSDDNDVNLNTVHDLIYIANITLGNNEYPVQLDTGSADLWVKGPVTPLPNANQTTQTYNLTYGIGWAFGHVSYAPVEFAGISVASQAFLDVSSAMNPALSYGADGILGLGFTSLSSIDAFVNSTGAATGRSLLYNLFLDNPSEPNFIAFSLQRSTEASDEVQGSFSVGEYEPAYAAVANSSSIPTWPVNSPKRWSVLLDSVIIGNTTVTPTTTVVNAPGNKAVVSLDSGTSYTYAPKAICDAIYSGVSGAQFDSGLGQWTVPCATEIDMALQIGGQVFPLHPLDVTPATPTDPTKCVGSFIPQTVSVGAGEFDWLIGDNFLRSVYSVYDFGDFDNQGKMGNPYVKLLALIDPNEASADFHNIRGGTPETNITYNASNDGSSSSSSTSITLSTELAETLDKVGKYFPAMLGVMALNALVLLALVIIGIVFLCKRRSPRVPARTARGRMSPMPLGHRNSYVGAPAPQPHAYQPVSMALTEDTMFVPPSPGFKSFEDGTLRPGDRPQSTASSRAYQPDSPYSDNNLFVPPAPAFRDRPNSVA